MEAQINTRAKNPLIGRIEQATVVRAVRSGMTNIIPVIIIGAFALILKCFPVDAYQEFIRTFAGGFLVLLFDLVNTATFGVLSVYMTMAISLSYMKIKADMYVVSGGAVVASLISFFILAGANITAADPNEVLRGVSSVSEAIEKLSGAETGFGLGNMGPHSMFLAIITGLGASALYLRLCRLFRGRRYYLYTTGADREFNRMLSTLPPITIVVIFFALVNAFVIRIFDVSSFRELLINAFNSLFSIGGTNVGFFKGFFFVLLSSVLWFFGIHGSDTLEEVAAKYFIPNVTANAEAVKAGGEATHILTKEFFDCFVLMGGCGAAICLLFAILIFSKNRATKRLGATAAFPMFFNINELMVFGLPIILNPIMLIPFLLVPLVCYTVAYFAISTGLVPMITESVEWTTPIILGGYKATGSAAGSILQVVNIVLGVFIYLPFVRILDRKSEENARRGFNEFIEFYKENEQELAGTHLSERGDIYGDFAKGLVVEFRHDLESRLRLFYQPQYRFDGECIGVEALLRWEHPIHGMIYPPLLVKLAEEGDFLPELEEAVLKRALLERPKVIERFGEDVKLSINVTGTTVVTPRFMAYCRALDQTVHFAGKNICVEVTEQAALSFNDETIGALRQLKDMGLMLAIDDFSMGQTSIHYLKDNLFDIIKLDGSLVRGMFKHSNTREIISSIVNLAGSLNLTVLAEYVETEEQRDMLHEIGCDIYQGYLYSPAVPIDGKK